MNTKVIQTLVAIGSLMVFTLGAFQFMNHNYALAKDLTQHKLEYKKDKLMNRRYDVQRRIWDLELRRQQQPLTPYMEKTLQGLKLEDINISTELEFLRSK